MFLEQYHLLDKKYNLNTLRVVNFGPQLGKSVYIYDITATILYYHAQSTISLKRHLGIHPSSCAKYVDTKIPFLGLFILLSFPIITANLSNLSETEFLDWLNKERQAFYASGSRRSKSIILQPQDNVLEFPSLVSCALYFRINLGIIIKRDTLSNYIKKGKPFHGPDPAQLTCFFLILD